MEKDKIESIVRGVVERMKEKARIDEIADGVFERLWSVFLKTVRRSMAGGLDTLCIPPREEALYLWRKALPNGAEFDKDVDLDLIVEMYPLDRSEIEGAVERAYKLAMEQMPGKAVARKQKSPSRKITISDEKLRLGIVWALGDKVLLERIDLLNEGKEGEPCEIKHWCDTHPDDKNFACWSEERRFEEGRVISYCQPSKDKTGFKCPENIGFDCNLLFRCFNDDKFIFQCDGKGEKKFKCTNYAFDCKGPGEPGKGNIFRCRAGADFDCKPIPGNPSNVFTCRKSPGKPFECPKENVKFEERKPEPEPCVKPHVEE